jgi:fucose 4-O-acetylase-like acetyltransferase
MQHRITAIDIMQGIAMLLVVLGHHLFPFMPEWYRHMYYWIYTFHMPLFIFISGFLVRYSYKGVHSMAEYRSYVGRRFRKFALPYIIVGVACALLAWNFGDVGILADNLLHLFIAPKLGEARFLWYLYLLFIFYCMAPLIFNAKNMTRWCIAGMAFYFSLCYVPSNYLCADYMTRYVMLFEGGAGGGELYLHKTI